MDVERLSDSRFKIQEILTRHHVPGATVAVMGGDRRNIMCLGTSNVRSAQPVIPGMVFRLASVTKPMVATATMLLAEEGRIALDAPLTEWFGRRGHPAWFRNVTPRHLLSHTAGIDCEVPFNLRKLGSGTAALGTAIDSYDDVEQWATPGSVMSYANTGYWILGRLLELATGSTFERAMHDLVFERCGMNDVSFESDQAILYPVAIGHHVAADRPEPIRSFSYPRARRPSGGVIASAESVLSFAAWHLDVGSAIATEMRNPVIRMRQVDEESWGLGWTLRGATDGTRIVGHGGSFDGYKTQLTIVPDRELALVVLTNSDTGNGAIRDIERLLLDFLAGLSLPTSQAVQLSDLSPYAGIYHQPHATIEIVPDGECLVARPITRTLGLKEQQERESRYVPLDASTFIAVSGPQRGARIDFIDDPRTHRIAMLRSGLRVARRR